MRSISRTISFLIENADSRLSCFFRSFCSIMNGSFSSCLDISTKFPNRVIHRVRPTPPPGVPSSPTAFAQRGAVTSHASGGGWRTRCMPSLHRFSSPPQQDDAHPNLNAELSPQIGRCSRDCYIALAFIPMCVQNGTIAARVARRNGSILNAHWY